MRANDSQTNISLLTALTCRPALTLRPRRPILAVEPIGATVALAAIHAALAVFPWCPILAVDAVTPSRHRHRAHVHASAIRHVRQQPAISP
jgi:hypothetical protein